MPCHVLTPLLLETLYKSQKSYREAVIPNSQGSSRSGAALVSVVAKTITLKAFYNRRRINQCHLFSNVCWANSRS